jgi:hypothetical protein
MPNHLKAYDGKYAAPRARGMQGQLLKKGSRYAPGKNKDDAEDEALTDPRAGHVDLNALSDHALQAFAIRNFNRRFVNGETHEVMVEKVREDMDVRRQDRYA